MPVCFPRSIESKIIRNNQSSGKTSAFLPERPPQPEQFPQHSLETSQITRPLLHHTSSCRRQLRLFKTRPKRLEPIIIKRLGSCSARNRPPQCDMSCHPCHTYVHTTHAHPEECARTPAHTCTLSFASTECEPRPTPPNNANAA